jgi:hypothetical protein
MLHVHQSFTKAFKDGFRLLERQSCSVTSEEEIGCGACFDTIVTLKGLEQVLMDVLEWSQEVDSKVVDDKATTSMSFSQANSRRSLVVSFTSEILGCCIYAYTARPFRSPICSLSEAVLLMVE